MKDSIFTYITIAIASFLVLCGMQFYLVHNTYQLENERYLFPEKKLMNEVYRESIINDKLFPGGAAIIDTILNHNLTNLEYLYINNSEQYNVVKQEICDSIFKQLRRAQSIDRFITKFKQQQHITDSLQYALTIDALDVAFTSNKYVPVYNKEIYYTLIDHDIQQKDGIRIGGILRNTNMQNRISNITVSSDASYTYKMTFSLYVDREDRELRLFKKMSTVYFLSIFSILAVLILFFVTFRNWLRQKKLSEMRSDFINSITHEFNTPLSAIIIANKGLQNPKLAALPGNVSSLTGVIERQSTRLKTLVNQVLDVTSIERLKLDIKKYSLHELLDNILLDYKLNLRDSDIELTFSRAAQHDTVELDQFYFTTALLNILTNAVKYNDKPVKQIHVTTQNEDGQILLSVADNGIGISKEKQKSIFNKFYRVKNKKVQEAQGLGLGLFYVKQCVLAHNWTITISSETGVGSTFTISIPLQNHS